MRPPVVLIEHGPSWAADLRAAGARWDPTRRQWRATPCPALEHVIEAHGLTDRGGVLVGPPPAPTVTPRRYQVDVVEYAAARGWRCLVGDEMGTGKTVSALAVLLAADRWPALIVCPTVVETHWRREAARVMPGRTCRVLRGQTAHRIPDADILVIGYAVLAFWMTALLDRHLGAFIADEAHRLGDPQAAQTKAARTLTHPQLRNRGAVPAENPVIELSGTPALNRTRELASLITILDRWEPLGGQAYWQRQYVRMPDLDPDDTRAVSARRAEHARLIARHVMIRRRKRDVLTELPPKTRVALEIDGDPAVMAEYRRADRDLLEYVADRAARVAVAEGTDPAHAVAVAIMRTSSAEALARLNVLRRLAARAKLGAASSWIADAAASGDPVTVYAHHRDICETLAHRHSAPILYGGLSRTRRDRIIDEFQTGRTPCLIAGIKAAGLGITLTAASSCLLAELAWNPGTLVQCEDRHWRDGTRSAVTATYLLCTGTVDLTMWDLIRAKADELDHAIDGQQVETFDTADGGRSLITGVLASFARRAAAG